MGVWVLYVLQYRLQRQQSDNSLEKIHDKDDKDLVQKEVADILGIDQRVYSNYETGKREIPTRFVVQLAKFYGVSSDYILGISTKK